MCLICLWKQLNHNCFAVFCCCVITWLSHAAQTQGRLKTLNVMGERKRSIPWVFAVTCGGFTERQAELLPSPSGYYQYISYIQYIMHSVHRFAYVIYISVYLCQHLMRLALYFSDQYVVHSKMFFCLVVMGDCLSYCCLPVSSK